MDVLTPHSLDEALSLKAELPDARFVQGGTDVLVELNFDRSRPPALINLNEVAELRGFTRENGTLRPRRRADVRRGDDGRGCAGELPALAEASRTVGSPQIRNRGTLGGNLGTASPAGDALPPLLVEDAVVEIASVRGARQLPLAEFLRRGEEERARAGRARRQRAGRPEPARRQTFMKVGPRNAMVISVCSLALQVDRERGEIRAAFGSAVADRRRSSRRRSTRPTASRTSSPSARARSTTSAAPPPTVAMLSASSPAARSTVPRMKIKLTVNGEPREADVWGGESLLFTLREQLELPGSKNACEQGECGSCSVLLDGTLVCSCLVLAAQADGHEVVTVEGVAERRRAAPRPGGVPRRRRRAVRVLHAGPDRRHRRPARSHAEPDRRPDPRGALRQPLPLHRLPEDLRRGAGRGSGMTRRRRRPPPRRRHRLELGRIGEPVRRPDGAAEGAGPVRVLERPQRGRDALGAHAPQPARPRPRRLDRHLAGRDDAGRPRRPHARGRPREQDLRARVRRPAGARDRPRPLLRRAGRAGRRRASRAGAPRGRGDRRRVRAARARRRSRSARPSRSRSIPTGRRRATATATTRGRTSSARS